MSKVEIAIEFCKGCQLCVAACPKEVLRIGKGVNKKGYRYSEMVNDDCIGCALCAISCPDAAIEVYKDEKKA
ncbi:MAG: ferredoxin family protein [Deltaproteobacteria bacterium]|nr:ferredoxin family protein [Deltaproteobacteria bacterium]